MSLLLHQYRLESSFEDMTRATVAPVELLCISPIEYVHALREPSLRSLHEQVVVVAEQTVGVDEPAVVANDRPEDPQKEASIPVVAKNGGALVSTADDVVKRAGELQPQRSSHPLSSCSERRGATGAPPLWGGTVSRALS